MKYESAESSKPIAILQGGGEREGWSNTRGLSHLMCENSKYLKRRLLKKFTKQSFYARIKVPID
jgi:hypothetical protein